ncbi:DsbC family protein [Persephonella sp. KM09-Lau-8]|uniref:DsbC family protein n=1 Tax=Persephonella sp. KM09-Lau-8 TaxID=1158345 RepID=UPI0004963620|nr:DsbC family protein [Persephonella sp. KM09-Lau-8]
MKKIVIGLLTAASFVYATDVKQEIKEKIEKAFPGVKVKSVEKSPVKCLYEVITEDGRIAYTDGKHLIPSHIFTLNGVDLTQAKLDKMSAKLIEKTDLSKALKIGNGKTVVVEVMDPECPYCHKAEKFFHNKDVTRYIFFMPLAFHKNARALSEHILCSDNPEKEYKKVMKGDFNLKNLKSCKKGKEKLKEMEKEVRKLGVRGTPAFWIKTDKGWKKISGANPVIEKILKNK